TFKIFIALSILAVAVFTAQFHIKSDLLSAGISESSVDGISVIAKDFYAANKPALGQQMDHETKATLFEQFMEKVGEFIQTQSSEDQAALKKLFKEKKADFEARMAAAI
ncbi:Protein CBG04821, partial [Caenorhabditis briggsae]